MITKMYISELEEGFDVEFTGPDARICSQLMYDIMSCSSELSVEDYVYADTEEPCSPSDNAAELTKKCAKVLSMGISSLSYFVSSLHYHSENEGVAYGSIKVSSEVVRYPDGRRGLASKFNALLKSLIDSVSINYPVDSDPVDRAIYLSKQSEVFLSAAYAWAALTVQQ
jgi:hypothetical protein